jgi:hypothetical protein
MKALRTRTPRPTLLALPLLLAGLPLGAASAQEAADASADALPDAAAIIARYGEVTKQRAFVDEHESMHVTGTVSIEAFGIEGTVEIMKAKPDRYLVNLDLGAMGGLVRNGSDGKVGWSIHPMMGARVLEGTELMQLRFESDWEAMVFPEDAYASRKTVGKTVFDGVECYEVELIVKPLEGMDVEKTLGVRTMTHFFEVETGFLRGDRTVSDSPTGKVEVEKVVSDYEDVGGGALMATKIVQSVQGMEMVFTIDELEADVVDAAVFELPKEISAQVSE